jgi:hypothetical protein
MSGIKNEKDKSSGASLMASKTAMAGYDGRTNHAFDGYGSG